MIDSIFSMFAEGSQVITFSHYNCHIKVPLFIIKSAVQGLKFMAKSNVYNKKAGMCPIISSKFS